MLNRCWKRRSIDVCFDIHTPTGRCLLDWHVEAFGILYSILFKPCTEIWWTMPGLFSTHFNTVCWFWWQSHTWTGRIACFLKDFQHGILNPFVSTIRLPLPRRDLRRPPPLREEVRFFVSGGRFPSIGDRECSVGSVESFSKWPDLNACYVWISVDVNEVWSREWKQYGNLRKDIPVLSEWPTLLASKFHDTLITSNNHLLLPEKALFCTWFEFDYVEVALGWGVNLFCHKEPKKVVQTVAPCANLQLEWFLNC